MKRRAPYQPGDRVSVLHSCEGRGTELAVLSVDRVVALATNNTWRLEMRRCDGSGLHVTVDERGRDRHGYLERVR
jgi:hypothetical protein